MSNMYLLICKLICKSIILYNYFVHVTKMLHDFNSQNSKMNDSKNLRIKILYLKIL